MVQNNTKFKQTEIGEIPENWNTVHIRDVCTKITKGTTPTTLNKKFLTDGIFFIKVETIDQNGQFLKDKATFIDEDTNQLLRRSIIEENDVLFSIAGVIGRTALVKKDILPANTNQALAILRPNKSIISPHYLRYYISSNNFKSKATEKTVQSVQANLSLSVLGDSYIALPSIFEQQKIVEMIKSLDDKIELNQKTIKTLEEIGQAIFKRWFIDFEFPNEKGEPYKSSGGEMVESELGEIPKGWSIGTVKDIATIKSGFAFKGDDLKKQGDFGIVKIKNVNDGVVNIQDTEYISESTSKKATNFKLSFGDVLIAMSGNTTGKIGIMPKTDLTFYLNQRVGKYFIKDKKEVLKGFLYFYITRPDIKQNTIEKAYGSAQPNISPSILESCEIVIPPTNEFETIFNFFNQIIFEISEKTYEIVKTSNLRDSLLPKLLSGKIRV